MRLRWGARAWRGPSRNPAAGHGSIKPSPRTTLGSCARPLTTTSMGTRAAGDPGEHRGVRGRESRPAIPSILKWQVRAKELGGTVTITAPALLSVATGAAVRGQCGSEIRVSGVLQVA